MSNSQKPAKKVLFYVQHLLGVGHVFRARRLCEGFAAAGLDIEIIFGGEPLPDMTFAADAVHLLPPIRAGAIDYSFNVDVDGNRLSREYMARRQEKLLEIFAGLSPDLILFEAWPFGRRVVRHEILTMLNAAQSRTRPPLVYSSVRDILQESRKPGRSEEVIGVIDKYVDGVLVHSDPKIIRLDETFPLANKIADKLHYTGFVRAEQKTEAHASEKFDVIVTIGGGAFGEGLIKAALAARALSSMKSAQWCLATGPNLPADSVAFLQNNCPDGVTITPFLPDLASHLVRAGLSISQVGYNTTMDVLSAGENGGCKALFVPSDIAGQTEQLRRAQLLEGKGLAICLPESRLTAQSLADAIDRAMALPSRSVNIDFSGVETSAGIIRKVLDERGAI